MKVETKEIVTFNDGSELAVPKHLKEFMWVALDRARNSSEGGIHIEAIKFLRSEYDISLKNAKDLVDYWRGMYFDKDAA